MHDFRYRGDRLFCEETDVADVAAGVGTPFYLYSHRTIVDHFDKIRDAFAPLGSLPGGGGAAEGFPLICYAMKANANLAVLRILVGRGAGLDVVSGGELRKGLRAGVAPGKVVYASVGKTDDEIRLGLVKGILLFNVESLPELERIQAIAAETGRRARVALRINPDVAAPTHSFITTGTLKNKFGLDLATARRIFQRAAAYPAVDLVGLHLHLGSQITTGRPFLEALRRTLDFIGELRAAGVRLEYLDIGGGLGIVYRNERPQTAREFARAVLPVLKKTGLKIILEPGRFIVGNAGIFVTRVLYLKDNGFKKFLIVDGGMNDLIRPAFYDAYHEIRPVVRTQGRRIRCDVVGPVCESGDFFARDRLLPPCRTGELLAVMSTGAYGYVMASNYNARPRPAEVLVRGGRFAVVRRRETFADLVRGECVPVFLEGERA